MHKKEMVHIYIAEYYSAIKEDWSSMDNDQTKGRSQEEDKYPMVPLIWRIENKTEMNLSTKQKQTQRHRK